ncbi:MAG: type IX secretion system outer membrane channel protein PorV, partial [Sphingobacteriales bacterium]|nr:type IX secretion system outer membrane channel protein PorV [Sphingobacteriales bacterium]
MKKGFFKFTGLVILFVCANTLVNAQTADKINVVSTAVPFLRISPDARSGGMGDVGIAIASDANAVFWNRAKVPFAPMAGGVVVTYTPWLKDLGLNDVYLASLGGYYQLDDNQAISTSLRYFSLGNIQFTNDRGDALTTSNPREFAIDLGYSRKLSSKSGLGIALRYINSSLAKGYIPNTSGGGTTYKAGSTVAADLSYYYHGLDDAGQGFTFGATLSNLGGKIAYTSDAQKDYIPANLGVGVAYTKVFDEDSKITFGLDLNKLLVPSVPTRDGNTLAD